MTETITADVVETPVAEAPAGDPQPARKFKLNWTEHTRPFEAPTYTCRITHGRQLQISLMSFLEHKLRDRPAGVSADYGGDDTVYVHLCSFGRMPNMSSTWGRRGPDDKDHLGWLAFETVTVFKNGQAPLDPEAGPLTTEAERTAAVHRSYPVAVEKLMAYCDSLFDPYDGTPPAVVPATTAGDEPNDDDLWRGYHNLTQNPSVGKAKVIADDVYRAAAGPMSSEAVAELRGLLVKTLGDGWERVIINGYTVGNLLAADPCKLVDLMIKDLEKGPTGVFGSNLRGSKFADTVAAEMDPEDLREAKLVDLLGDTLAQLNAVGASDTPRHVPSSEARLMTEAELNEALFGKAEPTADEVVAVLTPDKIGELLARRRTVLVDLAGAVQAKTVITVPAEPDAIAMPFTGLNRRDAAEKAIDAAKHAGTMVTLEHDGVGIGVHGTDTVDDVADRLLHPVEPVE